MTNARANKMGVDIGYWIFQAKGLTTEELKYQVNPPLMHWCGNHTLCGDWCITKQLTREGKVDNKKPLFDMNDPKDMQSVELIHEIQAEFTSPEKLIQMRHPYSTQLNESLNMQIAECAPKHKHFSRS